MESIGTKRTYGPAARTAFVAFGGLAYLGFHTAFLTMISFLNGGPLPWAPAGPTSHPVALAVAINVGWVMLFGLQHAVMARPASTGP